VTRGTGLSKCHHHHLEHKRTYSSFPPKEQKEQEEPEDTTVWRPLEMGLTGKMAASLKCFDFFCTPGPELGKTSQATEAPLLRLIEKRENRQKIEV